MVSRDTSILITSPGKLVWTGRIISSLIAIYMLVGGIMSVLKLDVAVESTVGYGYPEATVFWIGLALLVSTVLYAIPRTALLGAILLTGYLGGAVATHVRLEEPDFVLPLVVGVLVWVGLTLRDVRFRALLA